MFNARRQLISAVSVIGLFVSLIGISSVAAAETAVKLRFSSSQVGDPSSAHYLWYQKFSENLKKSVGDKITLQYFPNNQLGKASDVIEQVKAGSIDMMIEGSSIWANVAPEIGMLDLGYMFDSFDHAAKALDKGLAASLSKTLYDKTGVQIIAWGFHFGARSVYTKKQVQNLADVKGVKLRVLPAPAFIETFKLMGAVPTPISFGELYTSLQAGVVDGFEHDPGTVKATKLYEVTKFCWLTNHLYSPMIVTLGNRGWEKIPANLRPAFMKAAADATAWERSIADQKTQESLDDLKKLGVSFTAMSKEDKTTVQNLMQTRLYPSFADRYPLTKPMFKVVADSRNKVK